MIRNLYFIQSFAIIGTNNDILFNNNIIYQPPYYVYMELDSTYIILFNHNSGIDWDTYKCAENCIGNFSNEGQMISYKKETTEKNALVANNFQSETNWLEETKLSDLLTVH